MVNMYADLKRTYKGKKIFLTGHTGFKGAWLLQTLKLLGAEVKGYALPPENENDLYCLLNGDSLCQSVMADLRDSKRLSDEIISFQPDFVFHLAAQPLVRLSYEMPAETFEVNAIGTAHLLDGVRALEKSCSVVLITTDKVYHNKEWYYPYRENDRLGGYDPYSASKACAELIIDAYRNSFFNPKDIKTHQKGIAVGRAGNVIGGGDWAKDRLLPDIARALGNNQSVIVRNPVAVRPWQHVLESLVGYLLLGVKVENDPLQYSQAYNFGPLAEDALPVKKMVQIAISKWGKGDFAISGSTDQPHEAGLLKLDISKSIAALQWKPKFNAEKAIAYTMDWYKLFFEDKDSITAFTQEQIMKFIGN